MAATDILSLKDKNDPLVIMARDAAVIATPYGQGVIPSAITTNPQGDVMAMPVGWRSVGELDQKTGITITPDLKTVDVRGYGSLGPRRVVPTEENVTLSFGAQESKALNLEMFWDIDFSAATPDANGEVLVKKGYSSKLKYWSIIIIGQDETENGTVLPYWIFPKVSVTKKDAIKLGMEDALVYPLTFTAFEDPTFGGYIGIGHAGAGFAATAAAAGFDAT